MLHNFCSTALLGLQFVSAFLVVTLSSSADAQLLVPIAFGGDTLPGTEFAFGSFRDAVINQNGDVAFSASLPGAGFSSGGVYRKNTGEDIELVAQSGAAAAGTPWQFTDDFQSLSIAETGRVSFADNRRSNNQGGIWAGDNAGP